MHRTHHDPRPAFTLIELLVVMSIISVLMAILLPALARSRGRALTLKDGVQVREIHQAWVTWSGEFEGSLPLPGLIDREPLPGLGDVPGRGEEDLEANDHAALHSACIMNNYFSPRLCIGTTEPSGKVYAKDDYKYDLYQPLWDLFWDPSFKARLTTQGSNVSYAAPPLCGLRKTRLWQGTAGSRDPMIGNRGPRGEDVFADHLANMAGSITTEIHGGRREWVGQVCFGDNHVELVGSLLPEGLDHVDPATGDRLPDNLFNNDQADDPCEGSDIWLTIVSSMTTTPPRLEWD